MLSSWYLWNLQLIHSLPEMNKHMTWVAVVNWQLKPPSFHPYFMCLIPPILTASLSDASTTCSITLSYFLCLLWLNSKDMYHRQPSISKIGVIISVIFKLSTCVFMMNSFHTHTPHFYYVLYVYLLVNLPLHSFRSVCDCELLNALWNFYGILYRIFWLKYNVGCFIHFDLSFHLM